MNSSSWFALKHIFQMKCMCHITKKRIWGNKWTQSSERLLAIRISIWLGAHRSPASLREGGDILFMISGSFLSLLLCSCIWLLKWMNKMRLWEETLQSEHSNLTFFWGGLLLYYRCVCMRQRGVCSAIFKKEPLIFLTISVSLVPTFIFIFFLFLTFFPTACRSLSFGIGFLQSFQNNYTTWSSSLHFLSIHLLCLSQWGWILL